jgi:hypothetical protein
VRHQPTAVEIPERWTGNIFAPNQLSSGLRRNISR